MYVANRGEIRFLFNAFRKNWFTSNHLKTKKESKSKGLEIAQSLPMLRTSPLRDIRTEPLLTVIGNNGSGKPALAGVVTSNNFLCGRSDNSHS